MSWLESLKEQAKEYGQEYIESKGVKVFLKTDIGPEILIYDSDTPASNGQGLPIKYAVRITDREGKKITSYGTPPATNNIKAGIVWGGLGLGAFLLLSGASRWMKLL